MSAERHGEWELLSPEYEPDYDVSFDDLRMVLAAQVATKRPDLDASAQWDIAWHLAESTRMLMAAVESGFIDGLSTELSYSGYSFPVMVPNKTPPIDQWTAGQDS